MVSKGVRELVDIGANLTAKAFTGDLDRVLERARAAGVADIVVTGTTVESSVAGAALATERALYATAGIHPHHADAAVPDSYQQLRQLLDRPEVVAVGECGLDFNRNFSSHEAQITCFEAQLALAGDTGKPVFLHERDASAAFLSVIERYRPRLGPAVVHCFTGDRATLAAYLALDLHIGITGWICDERRGTHLRDIVGMVPPDRLMLETDAPYLVPRTMPTPPRDRRNEPAYLTYVLETVAAALGRPPDQVARDTTATARAFFGLRVGSG